ncbi:hypothetical protein [Caldicellulosiruptor naganoensis]|nr:hypothetical protein [Caldicellulosiruptor naganoensis]
MSEKLDLRYESHEHHCHDICEHMRRYLGETVTVFTESGGESGQGFTGVLALVTPRFVRLIVTVGTPPDDLFMYRMYRREGERECEEHEHHRRHRYCCYPYPRRFCGLGSIVDIPCRKIVAFVHNAV